MSHFSSPPSGLLSGLPRFGAVALAISALAACATVSKITIADRLQEMGLSRDLSVCVSDELEERLDDRQLAEFARFTVEITDGRDRSPRQILRSFERISDAEVAAAATASGLACIF